MTTTRTTLAHSGTVGRLTRVWVLTRNWAATGLLVAFVKWGRV